MSDFTSHDKAMAIVPKFSGFMSYCSSIFIVQHVLRNKKRRNLVYHRLLCGMSISDTFGSFSHFLSTWPIPKGEAYIAAGTVQTCSAAGFFNQSAALCTPTYNISLAIYYLLTIQNRWQESRMSRIEKYLHAFPILAGLGTGITGFALKLYNNAGWICWIAPGTPGHPERHNENYGIFQFAFLYAPAWIIIVFLAASMTTIYVSVLRQERKMDKYSHYIDIGCNQARKRRSQSRMVRNQAFLYVGCMYITWLFGTIFRFMKLAGKEPPPAIGVLFVIFLPLQGFFNLLVYMSPRYFRQTAFQESSQDASQRISQMVGNLTRKIVRQKATRNLNAGEAESAGDNVEDQENNDPNDGFVNDDEDVSSTPDCAESQLAQYHQIALDELATIVEALD